MCGIIGYIGREEATPILLKGLKNLEYRGYDSVGMATKSDRINICKGVGKIDRAIIDFDLTALKGNIGIGHTRWATHGVVSVANAHPHTDCKKSVAIVHNGIIENHQEIKEKLKAKGHIFSSDTDSEVIAHLIEEKLEQDRRGFEKACMEAFKELHGSYALLAISRDENRIVAARKDSPLVIGLAESGTIFSSDVSALLEWTRKVVYLQNYDVAVACKKEVVFHSLMHDEQISRESDTVEWNAEQARKGKFEHFMLKEIAEQAETICRAIQQDDTVVERVLEEVKKAKGIFFVGCGSSYHACLTGSYLFSKVAGVHVNVVVASEFENYEHFLTCDTLVFAVSQSGETADVLDAVRAARRRGSRVIAITNVIGSSLVREGDELLLMNSGPEICVLSTKTYTSQLMLISLLAYALAGRKEECSSLIKSLFLEVCNLTSKSMHEDLKMLAGLLYQKEHIYMIGRGLQFATAREAALKIKEVSYIHTEALAGGELKHGPLALIEEGTPVFAFVSEDNWDKTRSNAEEVRARGGMVIGVSARDDEVFDYWIRVPECRDFNPVIQAIPMQLLAYELAVKRELDPDKPRNLAKCVTVL
ncbi:Glutamine--fructose-6-phosphate aminotransferase [isomerizing] [uncultured archaeon]|nr:Glutamine--fructose-6-phosphate aminotransferase [isomerizing] [uncultured archaeon]